MTDSRNLSQVECDVSVRMTSKSKQRADVLRPRACWSTSCHCCHCPHWSSRCCACDQVVLRGHFVRELLYQEMFSLHLFLLVPDHFDPETTALWVFPTNSRAVPTSRRGSILLLHCPRDVSASRLVMVSP